jgi:hypothetical protein
MTAGTWLVETALRNMDGSYPAEGDWSTRSGNATEAGARAEVRQVGPHWRRKGLRVRVRFEAAEVTS